MIFWVQASGKYRAVLEEEAAKHKIRIQFHNKGAQWGRAALDWKMVWIPTPARFASFFTGLHELGHIIVGHKRGDGKPEYLWEYEAFDWARKYCQQHGIVVPARTVDYEREIIAEKAHASAKEGSKSIDSVVARFILQKHNGHPDLKWAKERLTSQGRIRANQRKPV